MTYEKVIALLVLANIKTSDHIRPITNPYWPSHPNYDKVREDNPWWVVPTDNGLITIGWRKRVIAIDWTQTNRRGLVTEDDVTKDDCSVHAWGYEKAVGYLRAWNTLPVVDVATDHRHFVLEGVDKIEETLKTITDGNVDTLWLLNVIKSYPHPSKVTCRITSAAHQYSVSLRVGGIEIHHYPRVKES